MGRKRKMSTKITEECLNSNPPLFSSNEALVSRKNDDNAVDPSSSSFLSLLVQSSSPKSKAPLDDPHHPDEKKDANANHNLRRTSRNIHRLILSDRASLQHRRLAELFFTDDENNNNHNIIKRIAGLELKRVNSSPHIYVIENFLNDNEIAYFQNKIRYAKFQKSFVDQDQNDDNNYDNHHSTAKTTTTMSSKYDENRTSSFVSFPKQYDKTIHTIEQRAANIIGSYSTRNVEPIQLVRYRRHQFFGIHHDLGVYDESTQQVLVPPKSIFSPHRRLVTFFVYLNSVEQGGATYFPVPSLRIEPVPGRAVLFSNVLAQAQPDSRTIHAGERVEQGIKYGLNIWIVED